MQFDVLNDPLLLVPTSKGSRNIFEAVAAQATAGLFSPKDPTRNIHKLVSRVRNTIIPSTPPDALVDLYIRPYLWVAYDSVTESLKTKLVDCVPSMCLAILKELYQNEEGEQADDIHPSDAKALLVSKLDNLHSSLFVDHAALKSSVDIGLDLLKADGAVVSPPNRHLVSRFSRYPYNALFCSLFGSHIPPPVSASASASASNPLFPTAEDAFVIDLAGDYTEEGASLEPHYGLNWFQHKLANSPDYNAAKPTTASYIRKQLAATYSDIGNDASHSKLAARRYKHAEVALTNHETFFIDPLNASSLLQRREFFELVLKDEYTFYDIACAAKNENNQDAAAVAGTRQQVVYKVPGPTQNNTAAAAASASASAAVSFSFMDADDKIDTFINQLDIRTREGLGNPDSLFIASIAPIA
jgi:hypothetical protein